MLKRFSNFAIYLLLVLMPLQSMAAANMLICNSMMYMDKVSEKSQVMPCHEHMNSMASNSTNSKKYKDACKANCAHCASLCAMAALPSHLKSATLETSSQPFSLAYQPYASVTLPNLQRPPICLS